MVNWSSQPEFFGKLSLKFFEKPGSRSARRSPIHPVLATATSISRSYALHTPTSGADPLGSASVGGEGAA